MKLPLSLYIHFPWCVTKCPYCDFNSHKKPDKLDEFKYIDCLLLDLEHELTKISTPNIKSIFLGGGTPSLFSGKAVKNLLLAINKNMDFESDIEITIETNPNSADANNFAAYKKAGVNRISIGAQSFNHHHLKTLGRAHTAYDINKATLMAKSAGFNNINLDIMFGLPQQSISDAISDLETAIELNPQHISWYQLTIEPNTLFYHQKPMLPNMDKTYKIQQNGLEILKKYGFERYEISAFSKPGWQCQHNLNYWQFGDYIGIGAGAHGKLSFFGDKKVLRYSKNKDPHMYIANCNKSKKIELSQNDLIFEFMLNALRLQNGFTLELFESAAGIKAELIMPKIKIASDKGLLTIRNSRVKPTMHGYNFLNDTINLFNND